MYVWTKFDFTLLKVFMEGREGKGQATYTGCNCWSYTSYKQKTSKLSYLQNHKCFTFTWRHLPVYRLPKNLSCASSKSVLVPLMYHVLHGETAARRVVSHVSAPHLRCVEVREVWTVGAVLWRWQQRRRQETLVISGQWVTQKLYHQRQTVQLAKSRSNGTISESGST